MGVWRGGGGGSFCCPSPCQKYLPECAADGGIPLTVNVMNKGIGPIIGGCHLEMGAVGRWEEPH